MINIVKVEGRSAPLIFCDWCGGTIAEASHGNCLWLTTNDGRPVTTAMKDCQGRPVAGPLLFVHKDCDRAWQRANDRGACSASEDLDVFLFYLGHNLKVDWKDAEGRARLGDML